MKYYFVNKLSNNGLSLQLPIDGKEVDVIGLDYPSFFQKLKKDDEVILVGGDGTINYFINALKEQKIENNVYLLANGTGDDFLNDIKAPKNELVLLNKYFDNLPIVRVNGIERKFINGIGFGVDGYCCEITDKIKEKVPNKKINYWVIAIKGLLFSFKPRHAKICVDGIVHEFDNVWIAPCMKGRYYGGGIMVAPNQDRFSDQLSVVICNGKPRIKFIRYFPRIFKGTHIGLKDIVHVYTGKKIYVQFDKPSAAQIDGETILNVKEYWAEI